MPLSDDQVTTTLDWLGRTQPVGQRQLALSTATGGAPGGGPVTGPEGGGIAPAGAEAVSPATGGRGAVSGGGVSPILQAGRVADLVRRAAGLLGPAAEVPGALGGPGAFGAQVAAEGGAQGLRTLGTTTGGLEGAPAAGQIMEGLGEEGGAGAAGGGLGAGLGVAGGVASAVLAKDDLHKAFGATNAALFAASLVQPELLPIAIVASLFTGGESLIESFFGGGPSKAWQTFGQRIAGGIQEYQPLGQALLNQLQAAKTPGDVAAATEEFRQAIQSGGTHTGGWGGVGGYASPSYGSENPALIQEWGMVGHDAPESPYRIPMLPGAGGSKHEGGITFDSGPTVQALRDAVSFTLDRVSGAAPEAAPTPSASGAQQFSTGMTKEQAMASMAAGGPPRYLNTQDGLYYPGALPPGTPTFPVESHFQRPMIATGPAGALGFSRDVLEAA